MSKMIAEDNSEDENPKLILATEYKIVSQGKDFLRVRERLIN